MIRLRVTAVVLATGALQGVSTSKHKKSTALAN